MKSPSRLIVTACLLAVAVSTACIARKSIRSVARSESPDAFLAKAAGFAANSQFDGANFYLNKALDIFRFDKRWNEAVQCLVQIGNNWQKIGDLEQAKTAFAQALQITLKQNGGENLELAKSLQQLAFKLLAKKEYAAALDLMNRNLAIQQKVYGVNHPELSKIYNSLALLYLNIGDAQKATEFASKSLSSKLRKFLNTDSSFLKNYSFLDGLNIAERNFEDMSGMLDKSLGVYLESLGGRHPLVASIYEKLGMVCALQGAYEQGLEFFRKALRIWLDAYGEEDIRVASLYEEIGICLRLQGDWQNARRYLQQALDLAQGARQPFILASIYFQLGKVCFLQNLFSEALNYYQQSLRELAPGFSLGAAGAVQGLGSVSEKQSLLEILSAQAEALEARAGLRVGEKNDLQSSFQAVQGAMQLIDLLRADYKAENYKLIFGEKSQQILDLAVRVALRLAKLTGLAGFKESAFVFSEKSKAALLAENMLESNARQFAGIPMEKLSRERDLKDELAQCETLLEKQSYLPAAVESQATSDTRNRYYALLAEYQELIATFERDYPQYFELKYGSKQAPLSALQNNLPANAALVEYFLGSTQLAIFFIARDRFEVITQPLPPKFAETIAAYCLSIKKIDEKAFLQLSPELYRTLIAPIEEWLRGKEKLLVIPDRVLAYLPFETLVSKESHVSDFSQLDFLVRRFAISYHFSGHLWLNKLDKDIAGDQDVWAGFAPVFSGSDRVGYIMRSSDLPTGFQDGETVTRTVTMDDLEFPELPGTERECRSIIDLFAAKKSKAVGFFHSQATEKIFKSPAMKEFSLIHLATHSLTNEKNPKLSGFLFHPPADDADGEDGILYAGETYNLNLDCKLLVLSSCESGTGRLIAGEGLLALTRGLFYSGARNIIFSLWKVEDKATGDLMVKFYREILQGETFAQAMKKAKLSFIADPYTAFPKYWAGFILLGM